MDIIRYSYPQKYKDKGLSSLFLHLMKQYVKKKPSHFMVLFKTIMQCRPSFLYSNTDPVT